MTAAVLSGPANPRQARLWRKTLLFVFLGLISLAAVAELVTSIGDRCETKDQSPILDNSGFAILDNSGRPEMSSSRAVECRLSEKWTIRLAEDTPFYIRLEYDRLPEFARPL